MESYPHNLDLQLSCPKVRQIMSSKKGAKCEEIELRRGPWTLEEDTLLIHYIARHGEGRWNLLARCSGLKRTGKSCRLRWLNYLKPDVKRGNLSPEEQFLILELHAKWGNRWSRIAQYLPGRTDNEIKNYWRTRVQKQARQLKIDVNSTIFRDAVRCYWMPRLIEKMAITDQTMNPNTNTPILPQQLNNSSSDLFSTPSISNTEYYEPKDCVMELPEFASSPENVLGAPYDPFATEFDAVDLATAPPMLSSGNDWGESSGDGLWSMDELWLQVRKQHDYGGGIFQ